MLLTGCSASECGHVQVGDIITGLCVIEQRFRPPTRVLLALIRVCAICASMPPVPRLLSDVLSSFHFFPDLPSLKHAIFAFICCSGRWETGSELHASERSASWEDRHERPGCIFPRDQGRQTHCHARSYARVCTLHQVRAIILNILLAES